MPTKKSRKRTNSAYNVQLKQVNPLTKNQQLVFDAFDDNHLILSGHAGTGKTFLALYLALRSVLGRKNSPFKKILIVRSIVQTRDIGFLPGNLTEKMKPSEMPFRDIVNNLCQRGDGWDLLSGHDAIEFVSTSFLRGLTIDDTIIIIDEAQCCNFHEIETVLTRVGHNTKLIICGDVRQSDLKLERERAGFLQFITLFERLQGVEKIEFTQQDIVRSGLVKEYLILRDKTPLI